VACFQNSQPFFEQKINQNTMHDFLEYYIGYKKPITAITIFSIALHFYAFHNNYNKIGLLLELGK
jgi:hypothetical protein